MIFFILPPKGAMRKIKNQLVTIDWLDISRIPRLSGKFTFPGIAE